MKISMTTDPLAGRIGDEKTILTLAKAGFDAIDYAMFTHHEETGIFSTNQFETYAKKLKGIADAEGIEFGQIHAHFRRAHQPCYTKQMDFWDDLARRAIITAAILEAPYVVIHPMMLQGRCYDHLYQENFDVNVEYYGKMIPHLKEYGVKVAIENLFLYDKEKQTMCPTVCSSPDEINKLCDVLGENFVACLDTGHALLTGHKPEDMIRALGNRLKVLHIHENNGYDDSHDIPFNETLTAYMMPDDKKAEKIINWDQFMKALKDVKYDGTFSLESFNFVEKYPMELADDAVTFMAKVARYLANK